MYFRSRRDSWSLRSFSLKKEKRKERGGRSPRSGFAQGGGGSVRQEQTRPVPGPYNSSFGGSMTGSIGEEHRASVHDLWSAVLLHIPLVRASKHVPSSLLNAFGRVNAFLSPLPNVFVPITVERVPPPGAPERVPTTQALSLLPSRLPGIPA